ncbi:MAG: bacteriohemerythrin [Gammaproteobacteria bacterium]|nr:bacteriohemerythrin [Gammaproteobacteria bacterium]
MPYIEWTDEFATGINVIDCQHKRIIHYINQLTDAQNLNSPEIIGDVLIHLIDYTLSHFAFEESLMDEAGYSAASIHKQTHEAFREKINSYHERYRAGENITDDLFQLLNIWLMDHIAEDDSSYVPVVKQNIPGINADEKQGWLKTKIQEFFS